MRLIIGICTYNRNSLLKELLDCLHSQEGLPENVLLDIVVCDNNPKPISKSLLTRGEIYIHEPNPGIVHARNSILAYGISNKYDALIFLDDDEIVNSHFVHTYIEGFYKFKKPAFIAAPVSPIINTEKYSTPWLDATFCYKPAIRESGCLSDKSIVGSGNVMINLGFLSSYKITFNQEFNVSGGEDALFFFEIQKKGGQGFWLADAEAKERLNSNRYTYSYFKERNFSLACAGVRAYRFAYGYIPTIKKWLIKAVLHIGISVPLLCAGIMNNKSRYKGIEHLYVGIGQICGLMNIKLRPYIQNNTCNK